VRARSVRAISVIVLSAVSAIAASEEAKQPALICSPWTKFCLKETCFVGRDVSTDCGPVIAAVLIEQSGQQRRILRVTLPASVKVKVEHGARIAIGQSEPVTRAFSGCHANGCMADHEAGAELVD
jgi:invasion protein IalB